MFLVLPGMLIGIAMLALPWIGMNTKMIISQLKDPFAAANLEAQVSWTYFDMLPGFIWLSGLAGGIYYLGKGTS